MPQQVYEFISLCFLRCPDPILLFSPKAGIYTMQSSVNSADTLIHSLFAIELVYPQELGAGLGRRSRPLTIRCTRSMAYGGGKARQTTQACCSFRAPSLVRSVVTEKSQRRRKPAAAASFDPAPTQQSLPYDDVEHPPGVGLRSHARPFALSDGACPTVQCSTANPGFVNPKHSTSPRLLPVYQRLTVRWRSCVLRRLYVLPPPLADGTCPTVHHSTGNSGIANPDRCTLPRAPSVY